MNSIISQNNSQWLALSGLIGTVLPVLIEMVASQLKRKKKILVVIASCLISSIIQVGATGAFQKNTITYLLSSFVTVLIVSINSWNCMWKKWFPADPNPIPIPPSNRNFQEIKEHTKVVIKKK